MAKASPLSEEYSSVPWWLTRPGRAGLAALLAFALAYAVRMTRPLFLPLAISFLLAVALAPIVRVLRRIHLPSPLAAGIVVAAFTVASGGAVYALADPVAKWIARAPETMRDIEQKLRRVKASVVQAREATEKVEEITRVDGGAPPAEVTVKDPSLATRMVATTRELLLIALEAVILLYFLLAFGESFLSRLVKMRPRLRSKVRLVEIASEIEREISNYLFTVTCINAGLGLATAIAMSVLGMPNPVLWGVAAAILNFIPYLGSAFTLVVLTIVAILTFETLPRAMLVPAVFLTLATLEGQLVTPIIVGRRMSLNPPVIVIALMVGAWIWGVVGLLIAVPVLAMVKIVCTHTEELNPIADLLGND
jgi:predicted PurR-regulated permease PerM